MEWQKECKTKITQNNVQLKKKEVKQKTKKNKSKQKVKNIAFSLEPGIEELNKI
jgi:hypothetical protein